MSTNKSICRQCNSKAYRNKNLCYDHYLEYWKLPPSVKRIKEKFFVDLLTFELWKKWCIECYANKSLPPIENVDLIRPDLWFVINNCLVIVEIDENQHNTKAYKLTDAIRTQEIEKYTSLYRWVVLIRINPDKYKTTRVDVSSSMEVEEKVEYPPIWRENTSGVGVYEQATFTLDINETEKSRRQEAILEIFSQLIPDLIKRTIVRSKFFHTEEDILISSILDLNIERKRDSRNFLQCKIFFDS